MSTFSKTIVRTPHSSKRKGFRFGIRGRLLLAFASVAGLTLVAAGVALLSYDRIGAAFDNIERQTTPAMLQALSLQRQAAEYAAASASLLNATEQAQLAAELARLRDARQQIGQTLDVLDAGSLLQEGQNARALFQTLSANAETFGQSIETKLKLAAERARLVEKAQLQHADLSQKLMPLIDAAQFNLQIGLQSIGDQPDMGSVASTATALDENEMTAVQALAEIRANGNLIVGLITEVSLAVEPASLTPLLDRFTASVDKATKAAAELADMKGVADVRNALAALVAVGKQPRNIFVVRRQQLDEDAAQRRIVAASQVTTRALAADVQKLVTQAQGRSSAAMAGSGDAIRQSRTLLLVLACFSVVTAGTIGWLYVGRSVLGRVDSLGHAIVDLARGDLDHVIPDRLVATNDELGDMARAVQVFKDQALKLKESERDAAAARLDAEQERVRAESQRAELEARQAHVVRSIAQGLERLSSGDLVFRLDVAFAPEYERLRTDFNDAMEQLEAAMACVVSNTSAIRAGADGISSAADDLSRRTEQQAEDIEQTAATLAAITTTVRTTADGAANAHSFVSNTKTTAHQSGEVVSKAIAAMGEIERSSQKISSIIGVIDDIAFQTNLLALNAGVEAARAGDAGRGFAVVASEVRALAQRSALAAKEIKSLIAQSQDQVGEGVDLVAQAGRALQTIVSQVTEIDAVVSGIADSSKQQARGLSEVNAAVGDMDRVVQQNVSMVENSTAASHGLFQEADELSQLVGRFRIGQQTGTTRARDAA